MKNGKKLRQLLAVAIVYLMAFTLGVSALAATPADFTDLPDKTHYSYSGVIAAIQNGIMIGDGLGHFMPENTMKRVEAATYLVRVMNAKNKTDVSGVTDYEYGSWYDKEGSLAIAINMGLIDIVNGRANPNDEITREESFEMMARAVNAVGGTDEDLAKFPDAKDISAKYRNSLASLVNGGYVHGSQQGTSVVMNPKATITRAEFATLFGRVFSQYITQPGTYTNMIDGNVIINGNGITLRDATITGDLIIGDGAEDISLDNLSVSGRVIIRGGSVTVSGGVEQVTVVSRNARLTLASDAEIGLLFIPGDNIKVNTSFGSLINTLVIEGKSARVAGYVLIDNAYINASGAVIESSPAETTIAKNITANIGSYNASGTFSSAVNAPAVTLKLGSGAYNNLNAIYSAAKANAKRNKIVVEIAAPLDDVLVIDSENFPGNNDVTVKYSAGFSTSLTYGVSIERSNVTLDGLTFNVSDLNRTIRGDSAYNIISVDGYKKSADGKNILIKNTMLNNCDINFYNEFTGYNVTAVYFDSVTTSGNTITGGSIDITGQLPPFDSIGIHTGSITLTGVSVKSSDRALVIECDEALPNVSISSDTQFYTMSGTAVELRLDRNKLSDSANAFGTVFGGYSNLKHGAIKGFIDRMLNSAAVPVDDYITNGVLINDYHTPLAEVYYKDENGYVWSKCLVSNTWVYCNTPVTGGFISGKMYMLTSADDISLTNSDTRYVKANGIIGTDFSDMSSLTTSIGALSNHPALNNNVRYKVVAIQPYTGEVKGLVASLTSIPYAVDTHLLANGMEYGADDPSRAGNLNSSRTSKINLTVSGTPDTMILLYLNLDAATLGRKGDSNISVWYFVAGVEYAMTTAYLTDPDNWNDYNTGYISSIMPAMPGQLLDYNLAGYDNPENPLEAGHQMLAVEAVNGVNTFIIKGDDGNVYCLTVTVAVG